MKKKTTKKKQLIGKRKTLSWSKKQTKKDLNKVLKETKAHLLTEKENAKNRKIVESVLAKLKRNGLAEAVLTGVPNETSNHIVDLIKKMNRKKATYPRSNWVISEFDKKVEAIANNPSLMAELSKKWDTVPTEYDIPRIAEPLVELIQDEPVPVKETLKEKHYLKHVVFSRIQKLKEEISALESEILDYTLLYKFLNQN